jgi:hypothetical protein
MAGSYAETTTLDCPSCGQPFPAAVWLIVDIAERPDLADLLCQGTIHALTCPLCNHQTRLDAPLLIHDADRQRLLFAPPEQSSAEQECQLAARLTQRLAGTSPEPHPAGSRCRPYRPLCWALRWLRKKPPRSRGNWRLS